MADERAPRRSEQEDRLSAEWELHRPAVFGVAYRLLGSVADAEDVTQDVWLRAAGSDLREVDDLRAWLVTVAARRSYDILKSARVRRETYVGPWLPEPLLTGPDALEAVLVDESVSTAMLLIMEELNPPERVAFVLHDVFGLEFGRIAEVLDVSGPAARQLASRARRRVAKAKQSTPQAPNSRSSSTGRAACMVVLTGEARASARQQDHQPRYRKPNRSLLVIGPRIAGGLLAVATLTTATACAATDQPAAGPEKPAAATTPTATTASRPAETLTPLQRQVLPNVQGKAFTSAIVDFPPGAHAAPHRHGEAFVHAYVLEGTVRSQVDDQPVTTFRPGQSWVEQPGAHHVRTENTSSTEGAKLLVVFVADTGAELKIDDPHQ